MKCGVENNILRHCVILQGADGKGQEQSRNAKLMKKQHFECRWYNHQRNHHQRTTVGLPQLQACLLLSVPS